MADSYDRGAVVYETLWSPVILPPAAALIRLLGLTGRCVVADALALPLADATAGAVILAYVLFHLTDPPLALAEAARVLRPGGRVAVITGAWERASHADTVWD